VFLCALASLWQDISSQLRYMNKRFNLIKVFLAFTLVFHFANSFSQKITKTSTTEILELKKQNGINYALSMVGPIPIYRVDSVLALDFAYDYTNIENEEMQVRFLSGTGQFIRDDRLNAKLIERLVKFRTDINRDSVSLIDDDLFYAIAYQYNGASIDPLKNEFLFWKEIMESFRRPEPLDSISAEKFKQSYSNSEANTFMIAWTLFKLKDKTFTADFVNSIAPDNRKLRLEKMKGKRNRSRRSDTLRLSRNYDSLANIDFMNDSSFRKILGILPASLKYSITLVYNFNAGIFNFESWFKWQDSEGNPYKRPYAGQMFKIDFISPNKVVLTWVYGYVS
jgi:hypothetical protein